uniref:Uncharacterized protein n=1 Tax=Arundo donax TaxID=35708 RepID=A0A0A9HBV8_ARUDO
MVLPPSQNIRCSLTVQIQPLATNFLII